ncbi:hypothetical protein Skr01_23800 [Sphaerisporangium krabiense]|uniref:DNA-binding transcriptional regulator YbjK n=1 Tax=Sphaerisporangium krabiense TaxID=763782 RepID=A0A7W8Z623_9ACTN|nr:TetR/AcrR family transcriptional regulator [Sphaerisporangium krabiense]MBB5628128.1 DNA-binding transcriptional regulator YbjK [Sphaerisporangium krabiense]GII62295.1 hypothetical protein Skr01_23800 [Sphaerisporangium krabiense]
MRREDVIADAAITLLVERGMRGLTHRAVDEQAGLPLGSTSNLARTRAALLALTLARLTDLEERQFALFPAGETRTPVPLPDGPERLADLAAHILHVQLTKGRHTTVARYELALEATRRPELREVYDKAGARFRDLATAVLAAAGSPDPARHGHRLVAYAEGLLFDAIAGAGVTPDLDDLRTAMREILHGMLNSRKIPPEQPQPPRPHAATP